MAKVSSSSFSLASAFSFSSALFFRSCSALARSFSLDFSS